MKRDLRILGGILLVLLAALVARSEEKTKAVPMKMPTSMAETDNLKPIEKGHVITIQILEDKREALQQVVAVTGEIQAPYLGKLKAEGFTCREVANEIKAGLEKEFFKEATVLVLDEGKHVDGPCLDLEFVVALGAIQRQGKYDLPVDQDTTVSAFLKRAGGYTGKNALPKIRVIRKTPQGNKSIQVNSKAVLGKEQPEYDLFLRPYDVMIVE